MKVGDLVRVKLPACVQYIGVVITVNERGNALVRSLDSEFSSFQHWVADWSSEVVSASR